MIFRAVQNLIPETTRRKEAHVPCLPCSAAACQPFIVTVHALGPAIGQYQAVKDAVDVACRGGTAHELATADDAQVHLGPGNTNELSSASSSLLVTMTAMALDGYAGHRIRQSH